MKKTLMGWIMALSIITAGAVLTGGMRAVSFMDLQTVHAAAEDTQTLEMKTVGKNSVYYFESIKGVKDSANIEIAVTNPEAAGLAEDSDGSGFRQALSIKAGDLEDYCLIAKGPGATSVSIKSNGKILRTYQVNVSGCQPECVAMKYKKIRTCESTFFKIKKLSGFASITLSADKDNALAVMVYDKNGKKDLISGARVRKEYIGTEAKTFLSNELAFESYCKYLSPKKAGKVKLNIEVSQDGYTSSITQKIKIEKYINPLKKFNISGAGDFAKYFNKGENMGDVGNVNASDAQISRRLCRKTLGGKKFKIKAKKGFKILKIWYNRLGDFGSSKNKLKGKRLPKDFWELGIVYKDRKGKKHTLDINYSMNVFIGTKYLEDA